ncbi:MAG TPA: hypothetical protein VM686_36810 [Polyangiaceae bacterium]|nr:hypothetical protein [Polyangiaceae bacterium]
MDRRVKSTKRDKSGNIVALCNPTEAWSPRKLVDVVRDINGSKRSYYVKESDRRCYVRIVSGELQTTADRDSGNSLHKAAQHLSEAPRASMRTRSRAKLGR